MGAFYVHDGTHLLRAGHAPDKMEELQAGEGEYVVLGSPPVSEAPPHVGARWHIHKNRWDDTRSAEQRKTDAVADIRRKRYASYPPIADQLDALWHAMDKGILPKIEPMYSQIKAVKDRHKKPGIE